MQKEQKKLRGTFRIENQFHTRGDEVVCRVGIYPFNSCLHPAIIYLNLGPWLWGSKGHRARLLS